MPSLKLTNSYFDNKVKDKVIAKMLAAKDETIDTKDHVIREQSKVIESLNDLVLLLKEKVSLRERELLELKMSLESCKESKSLGQT